MRSFGLGMLLLLLLLPATAAADSYYTGSTRAWTTRLGR